jgi:hypothetical protein
MKRPRATTEQISSDGSPDRIIAALMRRTIGTFLLCVAATSAAPQAQDILSGSRDLNRRGEGVNRLERWVEFVQAHRAGVPDSGTRQLESWTAADQEELTIDLPSLLKLMDDPRR